MRKLLVSVCVTFLLTFPIQFLNSSALAEVDPGCTNEDCPPDPGCTNEDCPPDPGCTNNDCPPDPGCTNNDCPPNYWAGCCCYEAYNSASQRTERTCCCNDGQNVTCRHSYVVSLAPLWHETISEIFVKMDPAPGDGQGLCAPDWLTAYLGSARVPLSETCPWWGRLERCPVGVLIDVKPGSDPNCLNINGNGVIPVAILGSQALDAHSVNPLALNFAGLTVRRKGSGNPQCSYTDVNGDGHVDMVCHFVDDPNAWQPENGVATLKGALVDGTPIQGSDSICIVP